MILRTRRIATNLIVPTGASPTSRKALGAAETATWTTVCPPSPLQSSMRAANDCAMHSTITKGQLPVGNMECRVCEGDGKWMFAGCDRCAFEHVTRSLDRELHVLELIHICFTPSMSKLSAHHLAQSAPSFDQGLTCQPLASCSKRQWPPRAPLELSTSLRVLVRRIRMLAKLKQLNDEM